MLLTSCGSSEESIGSTADWQPATLFSENAIGVKTKSDAKGNFYSAWAQINGSTGIYVNMCNAKGRWEVPLKIGDVIFNLSDLQIAVSSNGYAIVAWADFLRGDGILHVVRYSPDKGWGRDESFENVGSPRDVTIDNNGNIFIATEQNMPTGFTIMQFDAVSGWRSEWMPYMTTGGNGLPKIALNENGSGFVLYAEETPEVYKLYVRRHQADKWGSPELLSVFTDFFSEMRWDIVVDYGGNAMVIWGQRDKRGVMHTLSRIYSLGSGWGEAKQIDNSQLDCYDQFLTCDINGKFYAAWTQQNETSNDVFTCQYLPDSGWQQPQMIGTGGTARLPQIATDRNGNLIAVWQKYFAISTDPEAAQLFVNRYTSSSGWGTQKPLMNVFGSAVNAEVAIDPTGNALVIWTQSIGNYRFSPITYGIFSAWFK